MKRTALALLLLATVACQKHESRPASPAAGDGAPVAASAGGDVERGKMLVQQYGCLTCHIVPGIDGPRGMVGPSLEAFASRPMIINKVKNDLPTLTRYLQNPQQVDPQTAMPNLGLSEPDAKAIATFLHTLK
jgi:cytochrome c2